MANFKFNYHVSMRRERDGKTVTREGRRHGRIGSIAGLLVALGIGVAFFALFLPLAIGISLIALGILGLAGMSRVLLPSWKQNELHAPGEKTRESLPNQDSSQDAIEAEYTKLESDD